MTGSQELWIVSEAGEQERMLAELPREWTLSSNLLATEDGWIFLGLEEYLVGCRVDEQLK